MRSDALRSVGLAVAAVIVLGTGIVLTRAGRPYGPLLLNVHKLVDLGAVVFIGVIAYQTNRTTPLPSSTWLILAVAAALVVLTFATGGVVSGMREAPAWALWVHRIGSWVAAALAAASVYLLATA